MFALARRADRRALRFPSRAGSDLGGNFLSGLLPSSLANLVALTTLLLDDNLLSGTLPAGLTQLPRLTTLDLNNNRLNGSAVSGAQCSSAAVCASTDAFTASTCLLAGCGGGCAPSCRASCAVPALPGVDVAAVVAGCNETVAAASCNDCTVAMVDSLMRSGVALPDNNAFGRCLLDPMPQFIAASASPAVLSAALHNCAFTRRLYSNASCSANPSVADFGRAVAPCASPGSACNTCSASLVDILIHAGLPVAPLGLQFTTAHFELVSNCLARNVLKILQANVSSVTLLRGFAYCTGPSPGWYAAVQNATRAAAAAAFSSSSKSRSNVVVGAVVGATCGAAVVGAVAFVVVRRRARRPSTSGRVKDASASASIVSGSSGGASKQSSVMSTMKPMLLGEELVVGDLIGSGGYARVHRAAWNGTQVAAKCFEPLPWLNPMNLNRWESGPSFGLKVNAGADSHTDSRSLLGGSSVDSQDKIGSLMQELQLLQSLRHPNICAVYGLVLRPPMLVIELATAGSLAALLKRSSLTSLQWHARVSIATGVAAGVEFLHAQDPPVIHRDLKSANVVLSDTLVPKVSSSEVLCCVTAVDLRRPTAVRLWAVARAAGAGLHGDASRHAAVHGARGGARAAHRAADGHRHLRPGRGAERPDARGRVRAARRRRGSALRLQPAGGARAVRAIQHRLCHHHRRARAAAARGDRCELPSCGANGPA